MKSSNSPNLFVAAVIVLLLTASLIGGLLAQNTTQSPSPSPSVSPSPSPSRSPSPTPLPGAQNFHQWGSITVFNGLPSDSVRAIAQTSDGVMWFGTDNGLARFDGRRVQTFTPGGAGTERTLALKTADDGKLWIGTQAGAFVYSENRFFPVGGTSDVGITSIVADKEIHLGTDAGLVLRVTKDEVGAFTATPVFSDALKADDGSALSIRALIAHDGKTLAATPGRGVFEIKDGRASELPGSPRPIFVNSLARSDDQALWFGTSAAKGISGVFQSTGSRVTRIAAPTADVFALEANESGIWAGTERYGLFHFADSKLKKTYTFENTSGGLRSNTIYALFTDREGVLWIGTNRGVSRFDRLGASQETVSAIPNSNFIRTLFRASDGKIYAGSNRGLFVKNAEDWTPVAAYGNQAIYAISEDRSGKLLVGTEQTNTRSFADLKNSKYAAASGVGLVQAGSNGVVYPDASVNTLASVGEKLWIGTSGNGLLSFDGRAVRKEIAPDILKSGTIWKIFGASDGTLWIAGEHGVFRVLDGQPEKIIEADEVRDVFVDGDDVWAATTTRGLLHARNDAQFGWIVSSVGFEQGLPSEKAFSILPANDGLLIATNRGVVTYKRGSVAPKLIATRVLSQRVHDLSELNSTIALDYPQNSVLIEVAGQSSRTFPEEFQYGFRLKNGKGEIIDSRLSNDAQSAPSDLAPGNYTIEAIAFNRDLLASEPLLLHFSVAKAPFPWTATALAVLLLLSIVGLIWAVVEHRRITHRNRELAAARLDLANEAERERRRIARDLHDQTLADLRSLMIKSDKLVGDNHEFRTEIEAVSTEIRRICEDLSPSVLENVGLVAALEFLLDRTAESRSFTADDSVEERINLPLNVQLQIYRIAQEVLTNIVRHSDATEIEMNVEASADGEFSLTIRDNGGTFQPEGAVSTGRGISNIRSRANLINGKVAWKESRNGGNVFSLRVGPAKG